MKRFEEEKLYFQNIKFPNHNNDPFPDNYFFINNADNIFPTQWTNRQVFVFFDYFDVKTNTGDTNLYCLFPNSINGKKVIWICPRDFFVVFASNIIYYFKYLLYGYESVAKIIFGNKMIVSPQQISTVNGQNSNSRLWDEKNKISKQREHKFMIEQATKRNNGGHCYGKFIPNKRHK